MGKPKDLIVRGARENNLKNVTLSIPKNRLTVFTGVSGSGKSSLVFDTIAVESQRQLNETYSSFIRHRLPHYGKPDVDEIKNLTIAVVVDQNRIGGNARSTVGTITDFSPLLRLLFSRIGQPFAGYANAFSFNNPQGMCPHCEGLGKVDVVNIELLLDKEKSLNENAIRFPTFETGGWRWSRYARSGLFDNDKKLKDYSEEEWHNLLYAEGIKLTNPSPGWRKSARYEGIIPRFTRTFFKRDSKESGVMYKNEFDSIVTRGICPECHGARLNSAVLASKVLGKNIADCSAMQISDLIIFLSEIETLEEATPALPILDAVKTSLGHLVTIGLGYLSLSRETSTLSGGESQRVKIVRHLGSSLTDLTYILDEPSAGLHPADVDKLNTILKELRDKGNTVLVVEHDPGVIAIADHIVDMGPKSGSCGGEIMYQGNLPGLLASATLTGEFLSIKPDIKATFRKPKGFFTMENVTLHNLKEVCVSVPIEVLNVITGVAGSGKSSLISHALTAQYPDIIKIDQSELRGSKRSNIATYTGIHGHIRRLFAKHNNANAALFSTNSKGACPSCKGLGEIHTGFAFMGDVVTPCDVCNGTGFKRDILAFTFQSRNIHEVLALTVAEALDFFHVPEMQAPLQRLSEVGLGYLTLGQPLSTFSGGERQRVKLAAELENIGQAYIFDEPSTGLHISDVAKLITMLNRLVDQGSTVIVIEHNLDIISQADWIIDMGPGGGHDGGQITFEGTPAGLLKSQTLTGQFLSRYLKSTM